jgi:hypothetical protein
MLSTIIDFVKPEVKTDVTVNIEPDYSKLSLGQLEQLEAVALQLAEDQKAEGSKEPS